MSGNGDQQQQQQQHHRRKERRIYINKSCCFRIFMANRFCRILCIQFFLLLVLFFCFPSKLVPLVLIRHSWAVNVAGPITNSILNCERILICTECDSIDVLLSRYLFRDRYWKDCSSQCSVHFARLNQVDWLRAVLSPAYITSNV